MNNLAKLRHNKKLSQREVASALNISQSTLSQYERGGRRIDDVMLKKLCSYYNTSADELLGFPIMNIPKQILSANDKLSEFIRIKRGNLSLREFAQRCDGISHTQIDCIERGVDPRTGKPIRPTVETLAKISKGTGVSVAFLATLANGDDVSNLSSSEDSVELLNLFNKMNDKFKLRLLGAAYAILAEQNISSKVDLENIKKSIE